MAKFLDARDTLTRMVLLDCSGVAYLLVINHSEHPPTTLQWVLAVLAFAAALLLHRRPPINLVAQTVLFAIAMVQLDDATINQVGTAWAIGELALWASRKSFLAVAVAAVTVIYLICDPPSSGHLLQSLMGLATNLGLPILLGLVVRTTRELGVQAEKRAVEEQRRRESEHRASRADERSAIARELHDVVAHHVASMVLRVGVARHVLPDLDPRAAEVFDDVHRTGTAALTDLRRLVAVLRDPDRVRGDAAMTAIDPSALPAALDGAVETARRAGVVVEAEIDPAVVELDAVRGLALLRLTQEGLTNVAKHAGPDARAELSVVMEGSDLHWSVTDFPSSPAFPPAFSPASSPASPASSPAFSPAAAPVDIVPGGGHGLTGMRERVEVLGGSLTAGPSGPGWRVATMLPGDHPIAALASS
ncbi:sensor histidine kinase [Actinoplanes awajinensis]|uniref:histidine kinase n=1 Tax=Actinoplanes awajinensis subsp. mycoplanecinus TaxID=135947 RepID=A0A0X3V4P6_9ACTN|nr:histidine kinase [Actinoplanes awajinensis]KUL39407.1 histidine kinase [Actinoplanes awajinensis subsp. mycoplanecinus]